MGVEQLARAELVQSADPFLHAFYGFDIALH
jgi:hypothetical protein